MDERLYFEGMKLTELREYCRKNNISGFSGLKKAEIIDLILRRQVKTKGGKKSPPPSEKGTPPVSRKPPKTKPRVLPPSIKEKDSTELIDQLLRGKISPSPKKHSGALYVGNVNNYIDNIKMYIESRNMALTIQNAETLKTYLKNYSFEPSLEKQMRETIADAAKAFGSPVKLKKIKKKSPLQKGNYKPINILNVQFGKKGEPVPAGIKAPKKVNITLDEFRKELNNPQFIKEYTQSVKNLMKAKVKVYEKRKAEVQQEYESINRKVQKLTAMGTSERSINDMYPGFDGLKVFVIDLEDLIALVKKKGTDISEKTIKEGLMEAINDPENGLDSLIGREEIKNQLASQIYSFSKGYKTFMGSFNNIAIYGAAGVGKSRLAAVLAFALSKVGILARDTVKIVTRADLVGQYVGHTAPRTRSALIETLEGILFIDEAYQLTTCPETQVKDPFGSEAITEIVNFLDKYIGLNIVIVAGYEGVMTRCFMTFNEGLPRRFPFRYILSPYSDAELTDILINNLKRKLPSSMKLDDETDNFIFSLVSKIRADIPDAFKNQAGDMLNLSASLNKTISSSFQIKWKNGNLANNVPIILAGFDDFLETKGFTLYT